MFPVTVASCQDAAWVIASRRVPRLVMLDSSALGSDGNLEIGVLVRWVFCVARSICEHLRGNLQYYSTTYANYLSVFFATDPAQLAGDGRMGEEMARPKIVEMDYFRFQEALRRAIDAGQRIDKSDKTRWKAWVREHEIREAAFRTFGAGMYDGLEPVIIETEGDWMGYYLVSQIEEACLKWFRPE